MGVAVADSDISSLSLGSDISSLSLGSHSAAAKALSPIMVIIILNS